MIVKSGNEERIFKYVTDCLGSVIEIKELVDGALESRLKCSYDAWGNRTVSGGTSITFNDGYSILMSNLNPFYYRGYYYDIETKFYYLQTRYYDPALGRFINPDTIDYLDPESINGLNLYAYCNNNPIMYVDPTGHFVITIGSIITAALITAGIGAGLAAGSAVIKDLENGQLFDGDVTLSHYVGSIVGGAIAGFGIGIGGALGAAIGASAAGAATLGFTLSIGTALGIGLGSAATAGVLGYMSRVAISNQEQFDWSDLLIETGINTISGLLSFVGGIVGGFLGFRIPGAKLSFENFVTNQILQFVLGVYPLKIHLSELKKRLKRLY